MYAIRDDCSGDLFAWCAIAKKELDMKKKLHSEEYFGEQRDFWWNGDFLELMAKRYLINLSAHIRTIASRTIFRDILLCPALRSSKVMGDSRMDFPALWARYFNSI